MDDDDCRSENGIRVTDRDNEYFITTVTVSLENKAPIAVIRADSTNYRLSQDETSHTFTLTLGGYDLDGCVEEYFLYRNGTCIFNTKSGAAASNVFVSQEVGSAVYSLILKDNEGKYSKNSDITLTVSPSSKTSGSTDPNDKTVQEGYGEKRYVAAGSTLTYKIEFENDPVFATAPAQWIRVFDVLDGTKYDLDSFELKGFCIAGNRIEVGDQKDSFNDTVTLSILGNQITTKVSINLQTDEETGVTRLVAEFMAVDPDTGFMLQDLEKGMLPVNDQIGSGEGCIDYTIKARNDLEHGAEITNTAKIYFDFNDPIDTPTTLNTVDSVAPDQLAMQLSADDSTIAVTLAAADADSGVAGFNVRYSTDGLVFYDYGYTASSTLQIANTAEFYSFQIQAVDHAGNTSEWSEIQSVSRVDETAPTVPDGFSATVTEREAALSWNASTDHVGVTGYRFRYGQEPDLAGEGTPLDRNGLSLTELLPGTYYYQVAAYDRAGNCSAWSEVQNFSILAAKPENLQGDRNGISWDEVVGASGYTVEYSTDDFNTAIRLHTTSHNVETYLLPAGNWAWRVMTENGSGEWSYGSAIESAEEAPGCTLVQANGNLSADVFFAAGSGTWTAEYMARHVGFSDGWQGTSEQVSLTGKNRITNVFEGSADANILVMTDDANGDALFIDDVFSAFPAERRARLAQIDEIRAGAGDDLIDMTSRHFEYAGAGLRIRGGAGDDVIWSGEKSSTLFGDAGDDRIIGGSGDDVIIGGSGSDSLHGGGGHDTFCFGGDWGIDEVEQLTGGAITLWFAEGDLSHWDESSMTYTDGVNRVTVKGVAADQVRLKFGSDGSDQYDELTGSGALSEVSTEKVFEEKNKGIVAKLG